MKLAYLAPALLLAAACTAETGEGSQTDTADLTTLTAASCATPNVQTQPKTDSAGRPIEGTAKTALNGCVIGKPGEAGSGTVQRASVLLGDNSKLATMTDSTGAPMFAKFTPRGQPSGSLATGQTQDVDVTLEADFSPAGRLRFTRKLNADGTYRIQIANVTPFEARILFFPVEVIKTGNLKMDATLSPEANGMTVKGSSEVVLEENKEQAEQSSQLVKDVFTWMTTELSR